MIRAGLFLIRTPLSGSELYQSVSRNWRRPGTRLPSRLIHVTGSERLSAEDTGMCLQDQRGIGKQSRN